ncbi:uncharacterized protein LOC115720309 [Cannabis sativa]|uniref:uncharacterized protein LOC115720309 n=1 Tax=Cannabis sativa TaxID=3483 RepID=UPI0029CA19A8|nr:uncharacterized protein LOC115720309 [Cannabis sativa]
MACISTVTFSFSINHQILGSVKPTWGIRQGDPLSPYLFLLCSEGLSTLIAQNTLNTRTRNQGLGLKIARNAPVISHIFFADDSLLFSSASPLAAATIKEVLHDYSLASGQMVNFNKSSLYFSPNTTEDIKSQITSLLSIPIRDSIEKYLGLPQTFGRSKKEAFNYLTDRVWSHLNKWNAQHFSKGGKEVLLKSVVQAIPSYAMACFKMPFSFLSKIKSMMACFWWGGTEHSRKIHWKKWSTLSLSKFHGGLGFRSMKAFNQAMLAKQAWRLLQAPTSLVATILKARYFPHTTFLEASKGRQPSLVWISISWGKELLKMGIRKSVGDGTTTFIFNDTWIPGHGKINYLTHLSDGIAKVSDLITSSHQWNTSRIDTIFPTDISQAIQSILLIRITSLDTYYWPFTSHGNYTVNSGYHQAHSLNHKHDPSPSSTLNNQTWWKTLWTQPIPSKTKHFIWRAYYDILPTGSNLHKRKTLSTPACCRCYNQTESLEHALFRCETVQKVWKLTNLCNFISQHIALTCRDILHLAGTELVANEFQFFLCLLWKIWHCRNEFLHYWRVVAPASQIHTTTDFLEQYQQHNIHQSSFKTSMVAATLNSEAPSIFQLKLSVDAAHNVAANKTSLDFALYNTHGDLMLTVASPWNGTQSALLMEAHALSFALSWCQRHNINLDYIVSDCKTLVDYICNDTTHHLLLNRHITRRENEDAHRLAKYALGLDQKAIWKAQNFYM